MDERFERALQEARQVLFLCSGNMIRSAFAELWARHLEIDWPVASAATTYRNERIHPIAARALEARGVAAEAIAAFRPRHVDDLEPTAPTTLVLGMTREHLAAWDGRGPRAWLLSAFDDGSGATVEIEDPMFTGRAAVLDDVATYVEACVARSHRRSGGRA